MQNTPRPQSQSFLHFRILPVMLPHVPCGMLNGTRCPKSQPAILDQTIFKLRVFKLKTVSYKVQCSKDIIFTAITSTQTRESVLHSHRLEKKCEFLHIPEKKKKSLPRWETPLLRSTLPRQPQHLHVVATAGSYEDKEPCPTQEVFSQLALFKWYRVFAVKTLKTYIWMYIYIFLRDSISLYINIFLS